MAYFFFPGYPGYLTSKQARVILCEAQNWRCCLCGKEMHEPESRAWNTDPLPHEATIEHILPRYEGGGDNWDNLAASHLSCNMERGKESFSGDGALPAWPLDSGFTPLIDGALAIAYREARARRLGLLPTGDA